MKCIRCFSDLQGRLDAVDVEKAVEFVLSCMNLDGGFGCRPGSESHAGQVSFLNSGMGTFIMFCCRH